MLLPAVEATMHIASTVVSALRLSFRACKAYLTGCQSGPRPPSMRGKSAELACRPLMGAPGGIVLKGLMLPLVSGSRTGSDPTRSCSHNDALGIAHVIVVNQVAPAAGCIAEGRSVDRELQMGSSHFHTCQPGS